MKKLWLVIPILILWFLSKKEPLEVSILKPLKKVQAVAASSVQNTSSDSLARPAERSSFKIQDYHQVESEKFESPLGNTVIYSFSQDGIPILGMRVRLKQQPDGLMIEEENTYRPIPKIPISKETLENSLAHLKENKTRYDFSALSTDSLVIWVREGMKQGELAFSTSAIDTIGSGALTQLVIRSDDGKILRKALGRK